MPKETASILFVIRIWGVFNLFNDLKCCSWCLSENHYSLCHYSQSRSATTSFNLIPLLQHKISSPLFPPRMDWFSTDCSWKTMRWSTLSLPDEEIVLFRSEMFINSLFISSVAWSQGLQYHLKFTRKALEQRHRAFEHKFLLSINIITFSYKYFSSSTPSLHLRT